jgi:hypothetical protein
VAQRTSDEAERATRTTRRRERRAESAGGRAGLENLSHWRSDEPIEIAAAGPRALANEHDEAVTRVDESSNGTTEAFLNRNLVNPGQDEARVDVLGRHSRQLVQKMPPVRKVSVDRRARDTCSDRDVRKIRPVTEARERLRAGLQDRGGNALLERLPRRQLDRLARRPLPGAITRTRHVYTGRFVRL